MSGKVPSSAKKTNPPPYFESLLSKHGHQSFKKLLDAGCDSQILGTLFIVLTEPPFRLGSHSVSLRPSDSWNILLGTDYDRADLTLISKRAKKLLCDIERLRVTPFVQQLILQGKIGRNDLLAGSIVPEVKRGLFQGLLNLPNLAKECGPRKRPDYNSTLTKIYRHIQERTGRWHDAEVAQILYDLLRKDSCNAPSLGVWRDEHGLT